MRSAKAACLGDTSTQLNSKSFTRAFFKESAALCFLLLFWFLFCHNLFAEFFTKTYLMEINVDSVGQFWMAWWIHTALQLPDASLFFSPMLNYPIGAEVITYDVAYFNLFITGLLRSGLGVFGSMNAVFAGSLLLSLLGCYFLLRQFTSSRILASLFSLLPFAFALRQGAGFVDVDLANIGFLTTALALWAAALKSSKKSMVIFAGAITGLTCLAQMYLGIDLLMFLGLVVVGSYFGLYPVDEPAPDIRKKSILVIAIGCLVALPYLLPSIGSLSKIDSGPPMPFFADFNPGVAQSSLLVFAMVTILPLGVLAYKFGKRKGSTRFWFFSTSLFAVFAAGTHVRFFGQDLYLPLPFLFVKKLVPFFWRYNFSDRFGRMAIILMVVFLILTHARVTSRFHLSKGLSVISGATLWVLGFVLAPLMIGLAPQGVSALMPFPVYPALSLERPEIKEQLESMAKDSEAYVVFDLYCDNFAEHSLVMQLYHQKPIANDPLRGEQLGAPEKLSELAAVKAGLCRVSPEDPPMLIPPVDWWKQQKVRYIIVPGLYPEHTNPEMMHLIDSQFSPAIFSEKGLRLYQIQ